MIPVFLRDKKYIVVYKEWTSIEKTNYGDWDVEEY